MTRTRRRASRALIAILVVTLVLGLILHLHNKNSTTVATAPDAIANSASTPNPLLKPPALPGDAPTDPLAAIEPTTKPAETAAPPTITATETKPAAPIAAAVPATQPITLMASVETVSAPAAPAENINDPVTAAKSKMDSALPLAARKILIDAITSGNLSAADAKSAKLLLNEINAVVVFSTKRYSEDAFGGTFTVPPGGVLAKIAHSRDVTSDLLMRINGITDPRRLRAGQTIKILKGPFNAIVYKSAFTLELWQGEPGAKGAMYVTSFSVGLGKDDSTPTGTWAVQNKLKNPAYYSPRGEGVISANDPKNPLGEFWIGLAGQDGNAIGKASYGIHGTIDPDSIGKQQSMGCIRLKNEDIELVFESLVEGKSTVVVKD